MVGEVTCPLPLRNLLAGAKGCHCVRVDNQCMPGEISSRCSYPPVPSCLLCLKTPLPLKELLKPPAYPTASAARFCTLRTDPCSPLKADHLVAATN